MPFVILETSGICLRRTGNSERAPAWPIELLLCFLSSLLLIIGDCYHFFVYLLFYRRVELLLRVSEMDLAGKSLGEMRGSL